MGKSRDCSWWVEMILMTESIVAEKDWSMKKTGDCQKSSAYAPMSASTVPIATVDKHKIIVKNLKRRKICVLSIRAVRNKTRVTHWSKSKFCGQGTKKKRRPAFVVNEFFFQLSHSRKIFKMNKNIFWISQHFQCSKGISLNDNVLCFRSRIMSIEKLGLLKIYICKYHCLCFSGKSAQWVFCFCL